MSDDRTMGELNLEVERLRTLVISIRNLIAYQEDECLQAANLLRWARRYADHAEIGIAIDSHLRKFGRKAEDGDQPTYVVEFKS